MKLQPSTSIMRRVGFAASALVATVLAATAVQVTPAAANDHDFAAFVSGLWPEAHARGVSRETFDAAFAGVTPDPDVIDKTRKQAEFTKTVAQYLATAVSDKRIAKGTDQYQQWAPWLAKAEKVYGVDRYVIMGVWGLETNFGGYAGKDYVIRSLATLAYAHYRGTYFRRELIAALAILQARHIDPEHMTGSWAGAMGQTQFMPSSFNGYAVDFDHDGKRDIWTSVPDAIGSTANYLRKHGWHAGESWGYEVRLPDTVSAPGNAKASFAAWASRGVRRADGGALPSTGTGTLTMPAGRDGPAFLVTPNFKVIRSYNNSLSYALGVALLGDRIAGWGPLKGQWPMAAAPRPGRSVVARD